MVTWLFILNYLSVFQLTSRRAAAQEDFTISTICLGISLSFNWNCYQNIFTVLLCRFGLKVAKIKERLLLFERSTFLLFIWLVLCVVSLTFCFDWWGSPNFFIPVYQHWQILSVKGSNHKYFSVFAFYFF